MRVGVLGTGMVGRAIAGKLSELGHEVVVGTRDPAETLARQEPDFYGNPPFAAWQAERPALGGAGGGAGPVPATPPPGAWSPWQTPPTFPGACGRGCRWSTPPPGRVHPARV